MDIMAYSFKKMLHLKNMDGQLGQPTKSTEIWDCQILSTHSEAFRCFVAENEIITTQVPHDTHHLSDVNISIP